MIALILLGICAALAATANPLFLAIAVPALIFGSRIYKGRVRAIREAHAAVQAAAETKSRNAEAKLDAAALRRFM